MVGALRGLVQPADDCTICKRPFRGVETAYVLVRVPELTYDTICQTDWHTMLISAAAWLKADDDVTPEGLNKRVQKAEALLTLE